MLAKREQIKDEHPIQTSAERFRQGVMAECENSRQTGGRFKWIVIFSLLIKRTKT
jgi:hypothetical protein